MQRRSESRLSAPRRHQRVVSVARRRPSTPGIDGLLLVDKPSGPTSHDVVAKVRRLAGQPRIGHGGTLDPFATGLLVLLLGKSTRLAELHLGGPKRYRATFSFGGATTTDDLDGERIVAAGRPPTRATVEALLPRFRGALEQIPPSHSAIRLDGARAYELARAGEIVQLAPRAVEVRRFDMTNWDESRADEPLMEADLEVSSGTYVRALARDLGAAAGSGAHLVALRRVGSGRFDVAGAHSLESIAVAARERRLATLLLPLDAGLDDIPALEVGRAAIPLLADGAAIHGAELSLRPNGLLDGDLVRLIAAGELLALARATATGAQPERVFVDPPSIRARHEARRP